MTTDKPKQLTAMEEFLANVDKMKSQFEMVLPEHIPIEKFLRTIKTAAAMDPKLTAPEVNRPSLWSACLKAAQDGLMVDGREAALVIFRKNVGDRNAPKYEPHVQYMPMMAGILKKVRNSGELASIGAYVVYKGDDFEFWVDEDGEHFKHIPKFAGGEVTHVYALAKTKDGGRYIEVMPKGEVETVRNVSRAKDSGPWKDWYGEMAKKTVVRRMSKRLPMSTDLDEMMKTDDPLFMPEPEPTPEPAPAPTKPAGLGKVVDQAPPIPPPAKPAAAPKAAPKPAAPPPPAPAAEEPPAVDTPPAEEPPTDDVPI